MIASPDFRKLPPFTIDEVFDGSTSAQKTHFAGRGVFDRLYHPTGK